MKLLSLSSKSNEIYTGNTKNQFTVSCVPFKGSEYEICVTSIYLQGFYKRKNNNNNNIICFIYLDNQCIHQFEVKQEFHRFGRLTFHQLPDKTFSDFNITLRDIEGKLINNTHHTETIIKIGIRPSEMIPYKLLHLQSNHSETKEDTPLSFSNRMIMSEWEDINFTNWEMALDYILIPSQLITKLGDNISVLNILTDIELGNQSPINLKYNIDDVPVNKTPEKYFFFKPSILMFHKINNSNISKITLNITGNHDYEKVVTLTEEEQKLITYCTLRFRKLNEYYDYE